MQCIRGLEPILIKLPSLREEAYAIADQLSQAHKEGHAWGDMAILCADRNTMDRCSNALHQRKLPFKLRKRTGKYNPARCTSSAHSFFSPSSRCCAMP